MKDLVILSTFHLSLAKWEVHCAPRIHQQSLPCLVSGIPLDMRLVALFAKGAIFSYKMDHG